MTHLDGNTLSIVWTTTAGILDTQEPVEIRSSGGPSPRPTDDDLLLLSIRWGKQAGRDGPNFVTEVALVFWTLKEELEDAELAEAM